MWERTSKLRGRYKELNDSSAGKSEVEINQDISKEIIRVFKQNLRKSLKEDELRKAAGKKRPRKRGASSQFNAEREKLRARRRKWDAIMNLTSPAKSLRDAYILDSDGEIIELKDIVEEMDICMDH
jgi:hypothetical protein